LVPASLHPSNSSRVLNLPSSDPAALAVSIVVPVRNEAENVAPLIAEITSALDGRWVYEIIYVNDGCAAGSAPRAAPSSRRSTAMGKTTRRSCRI
jgi:hypothetical protein